MKYTMLIFALLTAPFLGAQESESRPCRIDGVYAAALTGAAPGYGEVNGTGVIEADGNGKFTGNVGGLTILNLAGRVFTTAVTGTYKIAKDCSLTFTMTFVSLNLTAEGQGTISNNGNQVNILVTSPSNVNLTGVARKQQKYRQQGQVPAAHNLLGHCRPAHGDRYAFRDRPGYSKAPYFADRRRD